MALLTNISILLVLACFPHQLMLTSYHRTYWRRERARGQDKNRRLNVERHPVLVSPKPIKGKIVTNDKSECTWAATGEGVFSLGVNCTKADKSFSCEYVATPAVCPQYASNVELYWKQIARALKKQKDLCRDSSALVRTGLCKGAARDAHFRLRSALRMTASPSSPQPAATAVKSCQPDNKKLAEEYCRDSWSSFCIFFFTMVQDDGC